MKNTLSMLLSSAVLAWCSAVANAAPVNVNTASADEIAQALNGVGSRKAAAIVTYREQNGPFKTKQELVKVRGIGDKTLERNKTDILLEDSVAEK